MVESEAAELARLQEKWRCGEASQQEIARCNYLRMCRDERNQFREAVGIRVLVWVPSIAILMNIGIALLGLIFVSLVLFGVIYMCVGVGREDDVERAAKFVLIPMLIAFGLQWLIYTLQPLMSLLSAG